MIAFGNKEKTKLAAVTGLAPIQIDKLLDMGLIERKNALGAIVRHDAGILRRKGVYKVADIQTVLAERYGVSKYFVKQCMGSGKEKMERKYHCIRCGKEITWKTKKKNLGRCDVCMLEDLRTDVNNQF